MSEDEKFSSSSASSVSPSAGEATFVIKDINQLKEETKKIKDDLRAIRKLEKFVYFVVGAMIIVFAVTSVLICFDYLKNNEERYEKFIDKNEEVKQSFYTKEQTDNSIASSAILIKNELDSLKKCVVDFGFTYKCFNK